MKLKKYSSTLILMPFLLLYAISFTAVEDYRQRLKQEENILYLPPSELVKLISLDYKNFVSELLFIRGLIYFGERGEKGKTTNWQWLYKLLDNSTLLDPYNIDSYYFANAVLTWDGNLVKEANNMLQRGLRYRDWDWYLPWFLATNYAYFLKDNLRAADYYAQTSRLNPSFGPLAAKYYLKANRTEIGITFLKQLHQETTNKDLKKSIKNNIIILQDIYLLRKAIKKYKQEEGKTIRALEDLTAAGTIKKIPDNPWIKFSWDKEKNKLIISPKEGK